MRFVNIRELKLNTNKVIKLSGKNGPLVVTRRGRPVAVLRSISEEDLSFKIKPLWNRLRLAAERNGYRPADIEKLIKKVRVSKR